MWQRRSRPGRHIMLVVMLCSPLALAEGSQEAGAWRANCHPASVTGHSIAEGSNSASSRPVSHSGIPRSSFPVPRFHKFHVSNSQIEFNPATQSAEIIIRVFADDFQAALSQFADREVKTDRPEDWKDRTKTALIMNWLNRNFVVKDKTGRAIRLSWVGMEGMADMFWIYVEGKMPGGLVGAQVKNHIICDLHQDQVNVVTAKFQGKQIGMMFEAKDEFKLITDKKN